MAINPAYSCKVFLELIFNVLFNCNLPLRKQCLRGMCNFFLCNYKLLRTAVRNPPAAGIFLRVIVFLAFPVKFV